MHYINNWSRPVNLELAADSVALALPDGSYRLTLSDSLAMPTRWEVVGAVVDAGTAALTRGLEGTDAQEWPEGSVIYCSITAGSLVDIFARVADLESRVAALEPPAVACDFALTIGEGLEFSGTLGFYEDGSNGYVGSIVPGSVEIPTAGLVAIKEVRHSFFDGSGIGMTLIFLGDFDPQLIVSVNFQGIGDLALADAADVYTDGEIVEVTWLSIPASDWLVGAVRTVTITF